MHFRFITSLQMHMLLSFFYQLYLLYGIFSGNLISIFGGLFTINNLPICYWNTVSRSGSVWKTNVQSINLTSEKITRYLFLGEIVSFLQARSLALSESVSEESNVGNWDQKNVHTPHTNRFLVKCFAKFFVWIQTH